MIGEKVREVGIGIAVAIAIDPVVQIKNATPIASAIPIPIPNIFTRRRVRPDAWGATTKIG